MFVTSTDLVLISYCRWLTERSEGFTQEQMARVLKTQKSNISRLENVDSKISPTLSTIER